MLFYEYFHGDSGRGVGASHQTGWTGLVAKLLQQSGERVEKTRAEEQDLEVGIESRPGVAGGRSAQRQPDLSPELSRRNRARVVQVLLDARRIRGLLAALSEPRPIQPLVGALELRIRTDVERHGIPPAANLSKLQLPAGVQSAGTVMHASDRSASRGTADTSS